MATVILDLIIPILEQEVEKLSKEEIIAFENLLAKVLYDIDREEIAEILNGGQDGFLYRRGFVVGMGKKYYQSLSKDPTWAVRGLKYWPDMGATAEKMCFFAARIYINKFDEGYISTEFSKETGSNKKYWDP